MLNLQNTTYRRLAHFFFVTTLLLAGVAASAQKIDIDKKSVTTYLISFPKKSIDTSFHTFSYTFNGKEILPSWGMDLEAIEKYVSKLKGYQQVEKNGDLHLEITLQPIQFKEIEILPQVIKSKDKSGKETSTYTYKYELPYMHKFTWTIFDKNGTNLSEILFSPIYMISKFTSEEFTDKKKAIESYNSNRTQVQQNIATKVITNSLTEMKKVLSIFFEYQCSKEKFNIWILDTEEHPEYEMMKKHYETVKNAFETIQCNGITTNDIATLQPAIDYYKLIPEKYKATEKAEIKLRYAAYFNLANIYLHLDDVSKVKEYANLIIENDYEKSEGKDFIQDAKKLIELLEKKQAPSRRFPRF